MATTRPPIHVVTYGSWGSGKSTFASTFPKPMLVLLFDPLGKEAPYLRRGVPQPAFIGDQEQPIVQVMSKKNGDKLLVQIESYHDTEVTDEGQYYPVAYMRFLKRFPSLYQEIQDGQWKTVVYDSLTFMEIATRKMHQYLLHKHEKDSRKWFAQSSDDIEEAILCRAGGLRCNVVVLAHIDEDKDGDVKVYMPTAPGRLRSRIGAGYAEIYAMRTKRTKDGMQYYLQTRADVQYAAASVFLNAPDPCEPTYDALWATYDAQSE
jgi:hypothetical protein